MGDKESIQRPYFEPEAAAYVEEDEEEPHEDCRCHGQGLVPLDKLKGDRLPERFWQHDYTRSLKSQCDRTVKIEVNYTSKDRPDTYLESKAQYPFAGHRGTGLCRFGTGYIDPFFLHVTDEACPCHECNTSRDKKMGYFKLHVLTAAHVVYDTSEAKRTICQVFYDSPDRTSVRNLYGIGGTRPWESLGNSKSMKHCLDDDRFEVHCVSHDMDLYQRLKSILHEANKPAQGLPLVVVSHPHGSYKHVGFGSRRILVITFNDTHTPDTSYTIAAPVEVRTDQNEEMLRKYAQLFSKNLLSDTRYHTLQPLRLCHLPAKATELLFDEETWVHLPVGVTMTSMDGNVTIPVHLFTFRSNDLYQAFGDNIKSFHVTYDAATCKGSSGAHVFLGQTGLTQATHFVHAGKGLDGMSRTGQYSKRYYTKGCNPNRHQRGSEKEKDSSFSFDRQKDSSFSFDRQKDSSFSFDRQKDSSFSFDRQKDSSFSFDRQKDSSFSFDRQTDSPPPVFNLAGNVLSSKFSDTDSSASASSVSLVEINPSPAMSDEDSDEDHFKNKMDVDENHSDGNRLASSVIQHPDSQQEQLRLQQQQDHYQKLLQEKTDHQQQLLLYEKLLQEKTDHQQQLLHYQKLLQQELHQQQHQQQLLQEKPEHQQQNQPHHLQQQQQQQQKQEECEDEDFLVWTIHGACPYI